MNPSMIDHPQTVDLAAFAVKRVDSATASMVEEHLKICKLCASFVQKTPKEKLLEILDRAEAGDEIEPVTASVFTSQEPTGGFSIPKDFLIPIELQNQTKYEIIRKLGEGGMGIVFLGRHNLMDREVAMKVISRNLISRKETVDRFRREILAVAKLDHKNIARAYDAEEYGDLQVLVMEYVPGKDLAKFFHEHKVLPINLICSFVGQIAQGLQHADEQKMVHRDLKPQNVMVMKNNVVKILDFGLARMASEEGFRADLTGDREMMGTPLYMAPEQAQNAKTADIRSDLYSLGCTFYHLLAGRPPFTGATLIELLLAHQQEPPVPIQQLRPDVPDNLSRIVMRMMEKDPAKRFQKPAEVVQQMVPFIQKGGTAGTVGGKLAPGKPTGPVKKVKDGDAVDFHFPTPSSDPPSRKTPVQGKVIKADVIEGDEEEEGMISAYPADGSFHPQDGGLPNPPNLGHLGSTPPPSGNPGLPSWVDPTSVSSGVQTSGNNKVLVDEARATRKLMAILLLVGLLGAGLLYVILVIIPGAKPGKARTELPAMERLFEGCAEYRDPSLCDLTPLGFFQIPRRATPLRILWRWVSDDPHFRWCRCAQPPANRCDPSGVGMSAFDPRGITAGG